MAVRFTSIYVNQCLSPVFEIDFRIYWPENSKLEYLYRFYRKKFAKVTGPNQFSLAVGHRTTAKVDDCITTKSLHVSVHLYILQKVCNLYKIK